MAPRRFMHAFACIVASLALLFVSQPDAGAIPSSNALPTDPPPPGANKQDCVPSPEHPRPVVLVHGTDVSMADTWSELSPKLVDEGFCVYALNYGGAPEILPPHKIHWGTRDITSSAIELEIFVDDVLRLTGANQVDIVGHSQGGVTARQYMRFNGGADPIDPSRNKVHSLTTLGSTHHGTTFGTLLDIASAINEVGVSGAFVIRSIWGPAGLQQLEGSQFLERLNAIAILPGVQYTAIATRTDTVVTPPENAFLDDSGLEGNVQNVWIQDDCPSADTPHGELSTSPRSMAIISNVLNGRPPITPQTPCI